MQKQPINAAAAVSRSHLPAVQTNVKWIATSFRNRSGLLQPGLSDLHLLVKLKHG